MIALRFRLVLAVACLGLVQGARLHPASAADLAASQVAIEALCRDRSSLWDCFVE